MARLASHEQLNAASKDGAALAEGHLGALTRAYERSLRAAGRRAAARFRQIEPVTAAANPKQPNWTPPPVGQIIDQAELAADTRRKTVRLHRDMLNASATTALRPFGINFDIAAPTSQAMLDAVGQRIQSGIAAAIEEQVANAIQDGYAAGDSVDKVSRAIQEATDAISKPRADALARTDLNALSNGGSFLAASISGAAETKMWLATEDERTRETHAEADGQTVAIDDVFDVGGESAQFPGDPSLSDEESINCRCTILWGQALTASAERRAQQGDFASWRDHGWEGDTIVAAPTQGTLYLARHGLTEYDSDDHAKDTIRGWADDPLTDAGKQEAQRLADNLIGLGISAIDTSDLERASVTADIIGSTLSIVCQPTDQLRPWNLGDLQGRTSEDAADEIADYADSPDECVPGGESFNDFCSRFLPAISAAMARAQAGETSLLVTHSHNLKLARAWIENGRQPVDGDGFTVPSPGPAAVLACTPTGDSWQVQEIICDGAPVEATGRVPPEAHYRPADDGARACGTCEFFSGGYCSMFDASVIQDYVCDEWVGKTTEAVTSGGTMTSTPLEPALTAAASGDTGLPLSERDRPWDAGAAGGRVKKWASSDGSGDPDKIDYGKLARAYFWRDQASADGAKIGDFKLPFADIIGGKLTAVWRGVAAAAQRLSQTQGIDESAVQGKIGAYYKKAKSQYNDDSIKVPWASGSAAANGEQLAMIRASLADQGADILDEDELRALLLTLEALGLRPTTNQAVPVSTLALESVELTAAADGGTQWQATLCVADEPTVDSGIKRLLVAGGGSWLPLPLPLALLDDSPHADVTTKAPICGRIDQIWMAGNVCQASGIFFDASDDQKVAEAGSKAAALVDEMRRMGISVDLVDTDVELMVWNGSSVSGMDDANDPTATNSDMDGPGGPATEANYPNDIPPGEEIEIVEDEPEEVEYVMAFTRWVIGGATICPIQALTLATISLVASAFEGTGEWRSVTEFVLPGLSAAAAGLVPVEPPRAWFADPELEEPTPLTVTDEGQVYGHLALWDSCHTGLPGCVPPPRSPSGYVNFHLGELRCDDGERIAVGTLSFDKPHAGRRLDASRTVAHYDDTTSAGAHVRAGEDRWGIWLAGALNPRLSAEDARTLMASTPSGDWRQVRAGQGRDLVGALAVNVPGFPVPRERRGLALAASACEPCEQDLARELAVLNASAEGIEGLAALVAD